jgi:hypothetical protein
MRPPQRLGSEPLPLFRFLIAQSRGMDCSGYAFQRADHRAGHLPLRCARRQRNRAEEDKLSSFIGLFKTLGLPIWCLV